MFDIFDKVHLLIKPQSVCIDNNAFRLHYKLTVSLLVLFSFMVGTAKYFGDPIDCSASERTVRYVDNYCWFNSYVIVPKDSEAPEEDIHPYPAHELFKLAEEIEAKTEYRASYQYAYQWIEFILFVQAVLFFVPRYLWRYCWEQRRAKVLTKDFNLQALTEEHDKQKTDDVVKYLIRNKFEHVEYSWKFVVCEILNFANVLAQFLILKNTLGMDAYSLGDELLTSRSNRKGYWKGRINKIFPKIARCEIPSVAGGGNILVPEMCVLPINVFATKIYIFLWFYFLGLTVVSGIALLYRTLTIVSPAFRCFILKRTCRTVTDNNIKHIRNLRFSDWFILMLVGKNSDPFVFKNVIVHYNDTLVASRPSFSLVGNEKLYNADFAAAMQLRKDTDTKDSTNTTPKF